MRSADGLVAVRLRIPREAFEAWIVSSTVHGERRVVAPPPPVRGSFRRLFDGGGSAS